MPEPTNPPVNPPANDPNPPTPGAEPGKTPPTSGGDDNFIKLPKDELKELRAARRKLKEFEDAQKKAEEENLAKNKQFEELASKTAQERDDWKKKYEQSTIDSQIIAVAAKAGASDAQDILRLIDRSMITLNDDGTVSGIADAVKALQESKKYLFSGASSNPVVGSGTNPDNGGQPPKRFRWSDVQKPDFYREHEKDILQAMRLNMIDMDQ